MKMSKEMSFEEKLINTMKQRIEQQIQGLPLVANNYDSLIKVPASFYEDAWKLVDKEKILQQLAIRLEAEVADRIVNLIASEIATDIKQVLSNKERRESIRAVARNMIDKIGGADA